MIRPAGRSLERILFFGAGALVAAAVAVVVAGREDPALSPDAWNGFDAPRAVDVRPARISEVISTIASPAPPDAQTAAADAGADPQSELDATLARGERALRKAGLTAPETARIMAAIEAAQVRLRDLADELQRGDSTMTPARYTAAVAELGRSMRKELGEDGYDWVLFAGGVPNRIVVRDAPDKELLGGVELRPGDILMRYDGERIMRPNDLARLTEKSRRGDTVELEVLRKGQTIKTTLPSGPITLALATTLAQP